MAATDPPVLTAPSAGPDLTGHMCPLCGAYGSHGYGPRWYCRAHKAEGETYFATLGTAAATALGVGRGQPKQGSLF
jgi:hypothetical protein